MQTHPNDLRGLISRVQHYSIHDGPGIRTSAFFMGCPLNCPWCSNPECLEMRPRLGFYPALCIGEEKCGLCAGLSPESAAEICPPRAKKLFGEWKAVPELMRIIESDRSFYDRTGGGVTLTGGEVMLQWQFAAELLKSCKKSGINTCIETALYCPAEHMEAVYRYTDLVIADLKHMDSDKIRAVIGQGNELILRNLIRTVELGKKLVIRTPVVPGFNSDERDIRAIGEFVRDALGGRVEALQFLPYRPLGTEKYAALGLAYPMEGYEFPSREAWERELIRLADMLRREYRLPAFAGAAGAL
ncbi:MAG: glycyl-radical enzyme activating protein [Oscillospiraceae bacterium]|nr:glycyl-radical enzyme activating protein [Oscillospiraceae bacterium]